MASELAAANIVLEKTTVWANEMAAQAAMSTRPRANSWASMSHEIRTPMNGVLGMLTLLEQTELTVEQKDYLETIRYSGQSLLDIINQILDFSRIESGKLDLEQLEFDPRYEVEQAVELFAERAAAKEIELLTTISESVPARLLADPGRFRQILINLLGNAMKFTEKGQVSVEMQASAEADASRCACRWPTRGSGWRPMCGQAFPAVLPGRREHPAEVRRDGVGPGDFQETGGGDEGVHRGEQRGEARNGVPIHAAGGRRFGRCGKIRGVARRAGAGVHRHAGLRRMLSSQASGWGMEAGRG